MNGPPRPAGGTSRDAVNRDAVQDSEQERDMAMPSRGEQLRGLIERKEILVLPGCANALQAVTIERAGFEAAYMSGAGTAATLLGMPDAGFTSMTEVVMNARYIAGAIGVPLLCDADTGYGNAVSVRRTVHEFIRAGVGGIHIEDQVFPKRCGFVAGKQVVPIEEAAGKYRAAVDARDELDPGFVIIARTDARTAVGGGLDEAIARGKAYRAAGADVAYFEAPQSVDEDQGVHRGGQGPGHVHPGGDRPAFGVGGARSPGGLRRLLSVRRPYGGQHRELGLPARLQEAGAPGGGRVEGPHPGPPDRRLRAVRRRRVPEGPRDGGALPARGGQGEVQPVHRDVRPREASLKRTTQLRDRLRRGETLVAPLADGAYTAKIVDRTL